MKKLVAVMLTLILMLSLSTTAFADVIWIPEDLFLNQHMADCERTDRSYRALSEVKIYEDPESPKVLWTMPEGETCWVYYTYEDASGNLWGCTENQEDYEAGWIPLAYTELVYDHISFAEDYGHEFLALDKVGQFPEEYRDDVVMFWEYPGSESGYEFDMGQWAGDYFPEYEMVYEDAEGRRWGYVGYYMSNRHFWFCIDDPTADFATLFPDGAPEVEVTESGETEPTLPTEEIVPQMSQKTREVYIILTIGVIGCVVVSGVLLLRRKNKSR